ncbi:hypothetical protein PILCRDRAFT_70219, partial [Piloderma croceum F 1598]
RNAKMVRVSNARPNIALSVRAMKFDNYSMADLRFLIPPKASKLEDIDITLVYCNQRTTCEDCVDRLRSWAHEMGIPPECIAFYHAKIGAKRKRELEEMLRKGQIRILVCTDAVGMGCDMRNIARVVLWGLPSSFCALVQRVGRTGCDFQTLGEAILIIPASVIKNGTKEAEVEQAVQDAVTENQAENRGDDEQTSLEENGIELAGGNQEVLVNDGGVRVEHDDSEPEEETSGKTQCRRKLSKNNTNSLEARYLTMFACAARCLCVIWDEFFNNSTKLQLVYPETTLYKALPGACCCHVCTPRLFPLEDITIEKLPGLKRGKKKKLSEGQEDAIREGLRDWREDVLLDTVYPDTTSILAETVLGNDVIEGLATCGECIDSHTEMHRHVRWAIGYDANTGLSTPHGDLLLVKLQAIYAKFNEDAAADETHLAELRAGPSSIPPLNFYTSSTRTYTQRSAASSDSMQMQDSEPLGDASSTRGTVSGHASTSHIGRSRGPTKVSRGAGRVGCPRGSRAARGRGSRGGARGRRGRRSQSGES